MSVKLLTEHNLEFLHLKGGCTGLSESTLVKMSHYHGSSIFLKLNFSYVLAKDNDTCASSSSFNAKLSCGTRCSGLSVILSQTLKVDLLAKNPK